MKIIDIHTHCNCGSKYDVPETDLHKRNFPFLMEEYKNCGISAGGFSYYSALLRIKLGFIFLNLIIGAIIDIPLIINKTSIYIKILFKS